MKKLLISIGSIIIMSFVVVLFINATESKKDSKKAKTEVTKTETAAPCSATCMQSAGEKPVTCDPATCVAHKNGTCDPAKCKEVNCDPETCKMACEKASAAMKCDPAKCNHQLAVQK